MVEHYLHQSPLVHLHPEARDGEKADAKKVDGRVAMGEAPPRGQIDLRGDCAGKGFREASQKALGFALPTAPNTARGKGATTALWLGPDQWLILTRPDRQSRIAGKLREALARRHAAVTEIGEGRAVIALSGAKARDVLMKGCGLDLHPRVFAAGRCAQTLLAKASVIVHQTGRAPSFDIYVARSFAEYLWAWLADAAAEYGA